MTNSHEAPTQTVTEAAAAPDAVEMAEVADPSYWQRVKAAGDTALRIFKATDPYEITNNYRPF